MPNKTIEDKKTYLEYLKDYVWVICLAAFVGFWPLNTKLEAVKKDVKANKEIIQKMEAKKLDEKDLKYIDKSMLGMKENFNQHRKDMKEDLNEFKKVIINVIKNN